MGNSPVHITSLEVENVKRVKAVTIDCTKRPLTVIGGKNRQRKTTILASIAFALGGAKFKPSSVKRDDAMADPGIEIRLSNGIVVRREGKNSSLKVTDENGQKAGQALLNEFVSAFALDVPKFMGASDKEKAKILLDVIGVEEDLKKLESAEQRIYDDRHACGVLRNQKRAKAEGLDHYPDAPEEIVSAKQLIEEQTAILESNARKSRPKIESGHWNLS